MAKSKWGDWSNPIPPEVEAEHRAELKKQREKMKPEKRMLDEASIHWLELDDDIGEFFETLILNKNKNKP